LYTKALAYDPELAIARQGLADLYWERAERAEQDRDDAAKVYYEALVAEFDTGKLTARIGADAAISVASNPSGAVVHLFRNVERDRILVQVKDAVLGRTPVGETRVDPGSYVLVLRSPGFRDVRYSLLLRRGDRAEIAVNLYTDDEIGAEFVYVPAGSFVAGGDPHAPGALPRTAAALEDYAIGRFPVRREDYARFLAKLGRSESRRDDGRPDLPATSIDWFDALAYCRFIGERDRREVRLPTEFEWEKAARGTDGRFYPWGDRFDPTFCSTRYARRDGPEMDRMGAFVTDCSPYGVRDLAGGVSEWVADIHEELSLEEALERTKAAERDGNADPGRVLRGGNWMSTEIARCRAAARMPSNSMALEPFVSFRLCRTLKRD
jgi:serine/threonine-protein kinase